MLFSSLLGTKMATGFSVEDFLATPTLEGLDQCRKVDLCEIGAHFGVELPRGKTVAQLKQYLLGPLILLN